MEWNEFTGLIPESILQVKGGGAFLTANAGKWNPMTIGWAQFGVVWGKPIVAVLVRKSRFTYAEMEEGDAFTLSVPKNGEFAHELAYCGSHSGRDVDKAAETGMKQLAARVNGANGVSGCGAYFECRIVNKAFCALDDMDAAIIARYYGANQKGDNGDPHELYFGEVAAAYRG